MKPLAIDLFCGLGGWTDGLMEEGWNVVGFDIERHQYGDAKYPAQLVIQDVITLHGSQFRNADLIVASPPCQRYSYMAMPFSRGKREAGWRRWERDSPFGNFHLNDLFDACFRIQREACEAAGRHIPMVVENVKGAQPWVGRAKANFGSFYLWGDVAMVGNRVVCGQEFGNYTKPTRTQKFNQDGTRHGHGSWFAIADSKNRGAGSKNDGGSWFAIGSPGQLNVGQNPDGRKVPAYSDPRRNGGVHLTSPRENDGGVTGHSGRAWFADPDVAGHFSSKSLSRKAASAQIAKIPFALSSYVARCYRPRMEAAC